MAFAFDESVKTVAKLKVVGVGGAGGNAVNRMVSSGLQGVEFIAVNTDAMALEHNKADVKIHIGQKLTQGLGAGANPQVGMMALQEDRERVRAQLEGADMVFIAAGMGGGTGTGAAPCVAELAREMNILTVAVVTKPFQWEGPVREKNSHAGLDGLRKVADTVLVVPNQKLLSVVSKTTTLREAFKLADEVLGSAVRGISDIILRPGEIQVDFADVRAIMSQGGDALMGMGNASGENRATIAMDRAIHSPLLENISIAGATGVLVNFTGGEDMTLMEINDAMNTLYEAVGTETHTNIIFGTVINPEMKDELCVTVIATGFGGGTYVQKPALGHRAAPIEPTRRFGVQPAAAVYVEPRVSNLSMNTAPNGVMPRNTPSEPQRETIRLDSPSDKMPERPFKIVEENLPATGKVPFSHAAGTGNATPISNGPSHVGPKSPFTRNPLAAQNLSREEGSNGFTDSKEGLRKAPLGAAATAVPAAQPGRYRDMDTDVDYETPAFLRNQAD